jgi:hypothetical protein
MSYEEVPKMDPFLYLPGYLADRSQSLRENVESIALMLQRDRWSIALKLEGQQPPTTFLEVPSKYTYIRIYPGETTPKDHVRIARVIFGQYGSSRLFIRVWKK